MSGIVHVHQYRPRQSWISGGFPSIVQSMIEYVRCYMGYYILTAAPFAKRVLIALFVRYICFISLALAVMNGAPAYWIDGEWITRAVVEILFANYTKRQRLTFLRLTLSVGTLLLALNIVLPLLMVL